MINIIFITSDGERTSLQAEQGSVMQLAVENGITGIDGDCGGVCSCATCHVYVAAKDIDKVGQASEIESDMLELDDNANELSRLCCQMQISDAIDGIELTVVG